MVGRSFTMTVVLSLLLLVNWSSFVSADSNPTPPSSPAKLIFIHHSTGENWLADGNGDLGIALRDNNYFVSDTNYGWGVDNIGDNTDIGHWWNWFRGANSETYLADLYAESERSWDFYSRMSVDPGGENEIILFKSCFPNSHLGGRANDPPASGNNPLRGQASYSEHMTVGNAKGIYTDLLTYFAAHQEKLFIVITAPPLTAGETDPSHAANARAFNSWLVDDWLDDYGHDNVAVFDFYNVLTGVDNHHRWRNGAIEHVISTNNNTAAYPSGSGDSHPNVAGNRKATAEFIQLLNCFYNSWRGTGTAISAPTVTTGAASSVTSNSCILNGTVNPNGASTTYYFEYGSSDTYGWSTTAASINPNSGTTEVRATLTGLGSNTAYHYRLVAANSVGTRYGNDRVFTTTSSPSPGTTGLIQPMDLTYQGAFRLPEGSNGSNWEWSGGGMTYYPGGDPSGPNDGYPGSIFGIGHDHQYYVSEISIPTPIISSSLDDLNTATTLQEFHDITEGIFGEDAYFEIHYGDLQYLPAQGSQTTGKLHIVWGQQFEDSDYPTHMWCDLDLSNPQTAGAWHFGNYCSYSTNDYVFEIPREWANVYTPGQLLVSGRFREGVWGGLGPALFAYGPWNDGSPPSPDSTLTSITPLLLYGTNVSRTEPLNTSEEMEMIHFNEADEWTGGAWLTAGNKAAVVFVANKGIGDSWYGFANGQTTWPPTPDFPWDARGWWAESYERQIIFYDPADLAAVANGEMEPYEPQPYASLNIDQYLYDVNSTLPRYAQEGHLGAACFDRARGLLYLFQRRADGEKSLVHVWSVSGTQTTAAVSVFPSSLSSSCELGADAPSQTFEVWNSGEGALSYRISSGGTWLSCTPASGRSTGEHDTVTVNYSTSGLSQGLHTASITVDDPAAENSPLEIPVVLMVSSDPSSIYFPHIANGPTFATELAIINTSSVQAVSGILKPYDSDGRACSSTLPVTLPPNGRREIIVDNEFPDASEIAYMVFTALSDDVVGYSKYAYRTGVGRVAFPAVKEVNTGDIYVSHIACAQVMWTGIALVNTNPSPVELTIEFDNGQSRSVNLAANAHTVFTIRKLFAGEAQPDIHCAVIKNGYGVIGVEVFGSYETTGLHYLSGFLLKDDTAAELYYPHVVDGSYWWTGIVAMNPNTLSADATVTSYAADGTELEPQYLTIGPMQQYIGTVPTLNLPQGTAWIRISASDPVTGFELFGAKSGKSEAGYTAVDISGHEGVFAKIDLEGYTGIAFVNTETVSAEVALRAYTDEGVVVATEEMSLGAYEKVIGRVEQVFREDITAATYISYRSTREVVGFELNGTLDGMMSDALPGM